MAWKRLWSRCRSTLRGIALDGCEVVATGGGGSCSRVCSQLPQYRVCLHLQGQIGYYLEPYSGLARADMTCLLSDAVMLTACAGG